MLGYETEDQQVEALKRLWSRYGKYLVAGLLVVVVLIWGRQYWQKHNQNVASQASVAYEQLLTDVEMGDMDAATVQAHYLIDQYNKTPYAQLAALVLAQQAVASDDLSLAEQHLRWAAERKTDPGLQAIASIRLSRVLLAQGQFDAALNILARLDNKAFLPTVNMMRGDIYLAQDDRESAKEMYLEALLLLAANDPLRHVAQLKLTNMGGVKLEN